MALRPLTWRQVLNATRLQHGPLSNAHIYVVGCFDQKVTLHSQQLRAFNLAWALQEAQIVNKDTRVAVIGGGAAGLSVVAGLYKSGCNPFLFEQRPTWMHLQAENTTRYLHPNIYEWPAESLTNFTYDLPDLRWHPNLSSEVAKEIIFAFRRYNGHFVDCREKTVLPISVDRGDITVVFSEKNKVVKVEERFNVVIVAVGFGLEKMIKGLPQLSYWSNDDITDVIRKSTLAPSLIIGCGDGGLTDAIRLCFYGFQHSALEKLARLPELVSMGNQVIKVEATATSPVDHNELYRTVPCSQEVLAYVRENFSLRDGPVELTDRSGFLYRPQASRLNKLLVRHLAELGAIRWVPYNRIFRSRIFPFVGPTLNRDILRSKAQILVRIGPEHIVRRLLPGVSPRSANVDGYRLGSQAFFPSNFFRFPRDITAPKRLLILTAAARGVPGGGTAGELREVKALLTSTLQVPFEIKELGCQPRITKYASILRDLYDTVMKWEPDVILVLGSDFFPILNSTYPILRPFLPFRKLGQSIRGITRDIPIVYFGAVVPDGSAYERLYCVEQKVEPADIVRRIEEGFGGSVVNFVIAPLFYAIDWFFWRTLKDAHERLRKQGEVTFKFRPSFVWSEGPAAVRKLRRKYHKGQKRRATKNVYAGRMSLHIVQRR